MDSRVKLTAGRVAAHKCEVGKSQSFLWDSEAPGLGLRTTPRGGKAYIFQGWLNGKAFRTTLGNPKVWNLDEARAEARRLKVLVDAGKDPRQVRADALAAEQTARDAKAAEAAARVAQRQREALTLRDLWSVYCAKREPHWSEVHRRDHAEVVQPGGEQRKRSAKLTAPGALSSLADERLVDITAERVEAWAKEESKRRPTRTRLAARLLKACLRWCATKGPAEFKAICPPDITETACTHEILGKPRAKKKDVLQRQQLAVWFAAVQQIPNAVISSYLQALLLTGARREELAHLKWADVDFQWRSMTIKDKVNKSRDVPLTPYVSYLLSSLPRRNEWVFSSPTADAGRLMEPSIAHRKACTEAGVKVTLHGLRRSFATLSEWVEVPTGIGAQIQGHSSKGVREEHYIDRPLDLLRKWHEKIEAWILTEARIVFCPGQDTGLRVIFG